MLYIHIRYIYEVCKVTSHRSLDAHKLNPNRHVSAFQSKTNGYRNSRITLRTEHIGMSVIIKFMFFVCRLGLNVAKNIIIIVTVPA